MGAELQPHKGGWGVRPLNRRSFPALLGATQDDHGHRDSPIPSRSAPTFLFPFLFLLSMYIMGSAQAQDPLPKIMT